MLPTNLPPPIDDGACDHLDNLKIPSVSLPVAGHTSTTVDLSSRERLTIVFCYPRTAAANEAIPPEWDAIPGARGCTPQACSFRDNSKALYDAGIDKLFGLSTQSTEIQEEFRERSHIPYDILSDAKLEFACALRLPLFEYEGNQLVKRLTLAIHKGRIVKHWYPVFPPDKNVYEVLEWAKTFKPAVE
ncbi:putative thiol-specific antioxidant protein [Diaporthe sp. PMI_573]|nr:putative thiol-specific antioxidant protein [Diaporthaceae sp. PMI_573]